MKDYQHVHPSRSCRSLCTPEGEEAAEGEGAAAAVARRPRCARLHAISESAEGGGRLMAGKRLADTPSSCSN